MLSEHENALLTRVEGDAPMGRMMRRYWLPAIPGAALVAGDAPKRVRLLGEDLVAFRDPSGTVGLVQENCPHRGASLVLARNEDCGLRCLYHGWKVAPDGRILETPAEPDEYDFKAKVRAAAYPTRESGGMVWTYLGPPEHEPPPMAFPFTTLPESHVLILTAREECNWAQCLEGVIDSAHSNYLHSNSIRPVAAGPITAYKPDANLDRPSNDGAPRIEAENTPYGFRYAAIRKPIVDPDKQAYIRATLFIAPIYSIFPAPENFGFMQAFVPIDDTHTMFHYIQYKFDAPFTEAQRELHASRSGTLPGRDLDGEYRKIRRRDNLWLQDRAAMRAGSFSGITGVNNEDIAMQESMGPIYDRGKEHLGTSDVAVIRMRRLMLDAVTGFVEEGRPPLGLAEPVDHRQLRALEGMVPLGTPWQVLDERGEFPARA